MNSLAREVVETFSISIIPPQNWLRTCPFLAENIVFFEHKQANFPTGPLEELHATACYFHI